jgi:hypothetical protein
MAWKQEPDGFKGVKLGASRSDVGFLSEEEWVSATAAATAADAAHPTSGDLAAAVSTIGKDHCSGDFLGAERCERIDSIGGIGITVTYYFRNNKLVDIGGSFSSSDYDHLREIFIGAYGRPHEVQHEIVHTAMGLTVHNESLAWDGKHVTVFITKYLGNINDGDFSIVLKTETAERKRINQETKTKAIQSIK